MWSRDTKNWRRGVTWFYRLKKIRLLKMATAHGSLSSFDPTVEDWRSYIKRFLHYCEANDITSPERKRAILLSVCGAKTYQVIRNLTSPIKPGEKPLNEIIDLVTKHYSPKPSTIVQRFRFNSYSRDKGESTYSYIHSNHKAIVWILWIWQYPTRQTCLWS